MTRRSGGVLCLLGWLVACGGPAAKDAREAVRSCEAVKDLFRGCYDASGPDVACEQLRAEVANQMAEKGFDDSMQSEVSKLCSTACDARKNGRSWLDINDKLDCTKIASKQ